MVTRVTKANEAVNDVIAFIGLGVFVTILIFSLLICIFLLIGKCKLFEKCGKSGWLAIVPFYGDYIFIVEICGLHWAWFVGVLLIALSVITTGGVSSVLKIFVNAMCFYNLAIKGKRDPIPAMIFGGLFNSIVAAVYGFGDYQYYPEIEVKNSGVF